MKSVFVLVMMCCGLVAQAEVNLPSGGSAIVNGELVTCNGGSGVTAGGVVCACNSVYGKVGSVLVTGGLTALDECRKLNSSTNPTSCEGTSTKSGYYKCDCNSVYGKVGEVTIPAGQSSVEQCRKLNSSTSPQNCVGI